MITFPVLGNPPVVDLSALKKSTAILPLVFHLPQLEDYFHGTKLYEIVWLLL